MKIDWNKYISIVIDLYQDLQTVKNYTADKNSYYGFDKTKNEYNWTKNRFLNCKHNKYL